MEVLETAGSATSYHAIRETAAAIALCMNAAERLGGEQTEVVTNPVWWLCWAAGPLLGFLSHQFQTGGGLLKQSTDWGEIVQGGKLCFVFISSG